MATKTRKPKAESNGVAPIPTGEVFTLSEAATWLRVSESGLKADADSGRIPGRKVAGEWRFVKATLLAWLSEPEKVWVPKVEAWTPELEAQVEAEIAELHAYRKSFGTVGEL